MKTLMMIVSQMQMKMRTTKQVRGEGSWYNEASESSCENGQWQCSAGEYEDPFTRQFDTEPEVLSEDALQAIRDGSWNTLREHSPALGKLVVKSLKSARENEEPLKPVVSAYTSRTLTGLPITSAAASTLESKAG